MKRISEYLWLFKILLTLKLAHFQWVFEALGTDYRILSRDLRGLRKLERQRKIRDRLFFREFEKRRWLEIKKFERFMEAKIPCFVKTVFSL